AYFSPAVCAQGHSRQCGEFDHALRADAEWVGRVACRNCRSSVGCPQCAARRQRPVFHHDFRTLFSHSATLELQIVIKTFTSAAAPQPSRIDSRKDAKTAKKAERIATQRRQSYFCTLYSRFTRNTRSP